MVKNLYLLLVLLFSLPSYSSEHYKEEYCLAQNIYFEARDQSLLGQYAVGFVTLNRVLDKRFPSTVCQVVYQPYQFSWTHDNRSDVPKNNKAWQEALKVTRNIFNGKVLNFTQGALYYHADYTNPYWNQRLTMLVKIEKHIFYK